MRRAATIASPRRCSRAHASIDFSSSTTMSGRGRSSRCVTCLGIGRSVLGLVSSKLPRLESRDELRARIDEAARIIPLERLALSPQCGFASTHEGNRLTPEEQQKKLELVAQTAARGVGMRKREKEKEKGHNERSNGRTKRSRP